MELLISNPWGWGLPGSSEVPPRSPKLYSQLPNAAVLTHILTGPVPSPLPDHLDTQVLKTVFTVCSQLWVKGQGCGFFQPFLPEIPFSSDIHGHYLEAPMAGASS